MEKLIINRSSIYRWEFDKQTNQFLLSEQLHHFLSGIKSIQSIDLKAFIDFIQPDVQEQAFKTLSEAFSNNEPFEIDFTLISKNGLTKPVTCYGQPVKIESENPVKWVGLFKEHTDKNKAIEFTDERVKWVELLLEKGTNYVGILDLEGKYTYVSPNFAAGTGYTVDQLLNKKTFDLIHPDDIEHLKNCQKSLLTQNQVTTKPYRFKHKDGHWLWFQTVGTNLIENGVVNGILLNGYEVTNLIDVQNNLKESEARYRGFYESQMNFVTRTDIEGNFTYSNKYFNEVFGYLYPDRNIIGKSSFSSTCEYHHERVNEVVKKCIHEPGKVFKVEIDKPAQNGTILTTLWDFVCVIDAENNPKEIQCTGIDITDRITAEKKLKKSEEKYRSLFNFSPLPKWIYDLETFQILEVSDSAINHYGYSKEEFLSKKITELRPKEDIPKLLSVHKKPFQTTDYINFGVFTHLKKNGDHIRVEVFGHPLEYKNKPCMMVICQDVTDKENRLIEQDFLADISRIFNSESNLVHSLDKLTQHICAYGSFSFVEIWLPNLEKKALNLISTSSGDEAGKIFYQNSKEIDTFSMGEGMPGYVWEKSSSDIWSEIYKKHSFVRRHAAEKAGIKSAFAIPLSHDNDAVGILLVGSVHNHQSLQKYSTLFEKLESFIGLEINRKRLEVELLQIFDYSPDIICSIGFDGYVKKTNLAVMSVLGYSQQEILEKPFIDFVHPDDRERTLLEIGKLKNGKHTDNFENRLQTIYGTSRWLSWTITPSPKEGIMYAVAKDVSEQKELAILLDSTSSLARIGSWEVDLIKKNIFWSPMVYEIHEADETHTPELDTSIEFYRQDYRDFVTEQVAKCIQIGESFDFEAPIITNKGNERWVRVIGRAELHNGKCIRFYGSFQDIHQRKEAELRLKALQNNIPGVIFQYQMHPDGTDSLSFVSGGSHKIWGMSPEECMEDVAKVCKQIDDGGSLEKVKNSVLESARTLTKWEVTMRNILPDGNEIFLEGRGYPRKLPDGTIIWDSIILDVTDKMELQELLHETSKLAKIGSWEVDLIEKTVYWSEVTKMLHEVPSDMQPDFETAPAFIKAGTSRKAIDEAFRKAIKNKEPIDEEILIVTGKGNERWIKILGQGEFINDTCVRIYGSFQDIHLLKKAELERSKLLEEKNKILESIGDAFFAVDKNWTITYWNKHAEFILGRKRDEVMGKNIWDEFPDAIHSDFYTKYHESAESGEAKTFESYYAPLQIWIDVSVYPSDDGLSIYFKDSTLRKHNEKQLLDSIERFQKVSEATNDAIWDWDIEENTLYWGEGFKTLFGLNIDSKAPTLHNWSNQIHPDDKESVIQSLQAVIDQPDGQYWTADYRFKKDNGEFAFVRDKGVVIRNDKGKAYRMVGALSDVTYQKEHERELHELNESLKKYARELEISNEELEQFAFITSHDLQEPLRMITSFLNQLERKYGPHLDHKARLYIKYASSGATRMRQIILDLLEYSRAGKWEKNKEVVDLTEVVNEYIFLRKKLIGEKNASIEFKNLPDVMAYKSPLIQTIHSLLDNALKYSKADVPANIQVSVSDNLNEWEVIIEDNGIGIQKDYFDKIFVIFQRLHDRDKYDGTGIGLSIVKKHVESWDGRVWLESELDRGTTFHFTIPKN